MVVDLLLLCIRHCHACCFHVSSVEASDLPIHLLGMGQALTLTRPATGNRATRTNKTHPCPQGAYGLVGETQCKVLEV